MGVVSTQLQLASWAPELKPELSQYHTPVKLARRMVEWAGVREGQIVLEPSAGGGNIVRELLRVGAGVVAVEIDSAWAQLLVNEFGGEPLRVVCGDFLGGVGSDRKRRYDLAVMNPPLDHGVVAIHIAQALKWTDRVVSVVRLADLATWGRWESLWSRFRVAGIAVLVNRPAFTGSGGATDFCVVDIRRASVWPNQQIEHWAETWGP